MIKIIVDNLTIEGIRYEGEEPAALLKVSEDTPLEISAPIEYDFVASIAATDVIIRGEVWTTVKGQCGRCLCDIELEAANEDVCHLIEDPGQGEINITDKILEDLSVALPANLLCSDDCKGLCTKCGCSLNKETCECDQENTKTEIKNVWGDLDKLDIDN